MITNESQESKLTNNLHWLSSIFVDFTGNLYKIPHLGCLAQLGERRPYKAEVVGSNPTVPTICGAVVQLVRIPACHAGGRGFESRPLRQCFLSLAFCQCQMPSKPYKSNAVAVS